MSCGDGDEGIKMRYDKRTRQRLIQEIIQNHAVGTQEELADLLTRRGVAATQATVSRDIKDLGLVKVPHRDGHRYALPDQAGAAGANERLERILREVMVDVAFSETLVLVKTLAGGANVVSEAIDHLEWEDVLGTLAGDNTVLIVARSRADAPGIARRLLALR
jgi:transcriptional regulator of arginine metabolism